MKRLIGLRHILHQHPDLSGKEINTARRVLEIFKSFEPDQIIEGIGGTGLAFIFKGKRPGKTVLLRAELDAVPVSEQNDFSYKSTTDGVAHKCGHDGHMAILTGVGKKLSLKRPREGRVVLLFQPAEETGQGSELVINDPAFTKIRPDFCFAIHNLPGFELGKIVIGRGSFACASMGICVKLKGVSAHAGQPERGHSPAKAMCQLIDAWAGVPEILGLTGSLPLATVVGARLGAKAFGTAPANAEIWVTLRAKTDEMMMRLIEFSEKLVSETSTRFNLKSEIGFEDIFPATLNSTEAVDLVLKAVKGKPVKIINEPFRWSEDFSRFINEAPGALIGLGAGKDCKNLHNPEYDFPDDLIEAGVNLFIDIIRQVEKSGENKSSNS
ncbi:MAG: amidohydrolase [Candidatus Rifleibacteriota bacterium]